MTMKTTCKPQTWARYKHIVGSKLSMLRTMQYESLRKVHLSGLCLDVGGGEVTDYRGHFTMVGTLESVNIDPARKPTYIHDLNQTWPMADARYDGILSMNTFEHLYKDQFALTEMIRVLKPGAPFHIMLPFLYRVHGSPCDYHRHTAFWWHDYLTEIGATDIVIEQHSWERLANILSINNFKVTAIPTRPIVMLLVFLRNWMRKLRGLDFSKELEDMPVGYYISGRKA